MSVWITIAVVFILYAGFFYWVLKKSAKQRKIFAENLCENCRPKFEKYIKLHLFSR